MEASPIVLSVLKDPNLKGKNICLQLTELLHQQAIQPETLLLSTDKLKDTEVACCIEAISFYTEKSLEHINENCVTLLLQYLNHKAPRIKWEAARSIANIQHLFPQMQDDILVSLLKKTDDAGTVVRWSIATAIASILGNRLPSDPGLISAVEQIIEQEEKNSIKKIYAKALKKHLSLSGISGKKK